MNYYICEQKIDDETTKTAWSKARWDAERIFEDLGFRAISVCSDLVGRANANRFSKIKMNFQMRRIWKKSLSVLHSGDTVVIQLPVIHNCLFIASVLRELKRRNVYIIGLIHDLELLRMSIDQNVGFVSRARIQMEEKGAVQNCDRLIVHNERMKNFLETQHIGKERMVCLEIFDYLMGNDVESIVENRSVTTNHGQLIVAGNLSASKAGYIYEMPDSLELNLYGVFYTDVDKPNHHYKGAFSSDELPAKLEGDFGLIWDGPSAESCIGTYGEYLRYNNPHKTSLYLASGIPIVIWNEAALAEFVLREEVGIVATSISEAAEIAKNISDEEYDFISNNAKRIGGKLRKGDYLRRAVIRCLPN